MPYDPNVITELTNPLGDANVPSLIGTTISYILRVVGSIALAVIVFAGIKFMSARGNPEQVKSAMQIMLWAGLGLAMIFFSYLILNYVIEAIK
ncbi:MAG TPA: hypothetical protein DEB73_01285 [Candidatus Magasanikbacteria bacterium]|uniref:Uncharacterized protein n=2 Tax=Candidatus Magasanikiibacteriota TaxID=1752731 RepID=A0A0G0YSF6_9BACT|nr:MAG: hypothetical protein UU49_C0040G0003 [Candidatus Magasanikbacteria bacterium GW2011_GWC2_41_17]KKS12591.1 MAG: hypothetical protein UU69_C0030G0013 [Candidatus Magasanikbacteria bacterium GW2011_GWA2_41_55]HBV57884.1 hypothetical protein [Candidatus Magasanikbacteria bacterium]HBX16483.1 hypothetical protein [Candidatus Magasanikbacteria bacterium]